MLGLTFCLPRVNDAHTPLVLRIVIVDDESRLRTGFAIGLYRDGRIHLLLIVFRNDRNGIDDLRRRSRTHVIHIPTILAVVVCPRIIRHLLHLNDDVCIIQSIHRDLLTQLYRQIGSTHINADHLLLLLYLVLADIVVELGGDPTFLFQSGKAHKFVFALLLIFMKDFLLINEIVIFFRLYFAEGHITFGARLTPFRDNVLEKLKKVHRTCGHGIL